MKCTVTSGYRCPNIAKLLHKCLSRFGQISQFTSVQHTKFPTFLIVMVENDDTRDLLEMLDGQYLMGFRLNIGFAMLSIENDIVESEEMVARFDGSDIWSPQPLRPTHLGVSVDYGLLDAVAPCDRIQEEDIDVSIISLPHTASPDGENYQPNLPDVSTNFESSAFSVSRLTPQHPSEFKARLPNTSSKTLSYETCNTQMGKNLIDLDRIARGSDTRTTARIPHSYDVAELANCHRLC
ncbi:hypothetical protein EDC01DRAFT_726540 [Geopyxis carbonaria]|nr:hypothetical protein EDC01DRAFT_726540 [Geopyxis carbonaria]